MYKYHTDGTTPTTKAVFVFGSNLAARHGAGAAKEAKKYGASHKIAFGRSGMSYAIPTKNSYMNTLPITHIAKHVDTFKQYASEHPDEIFFVTRIGCQLAGYTDAEIAPLFANSPSNCDFAKEWKPYLEFANNQLHFNFD